MEHRVQKVLVIDADADVRDAVREHLSSLDVVVHAASDAWRGLVAAHDLEADIILLAGDLPEPGSRELFSQLQRDEACLGTPIVFLTPPEGGDAPHEGLSRADAFRLGASDCVTKPIEPAELAARVRSVLEHQRLIAQLERQGRTDALTGLPNRVAFYDALANVVRETDHDPKRRFAVIFIDLDHFKVVNDSLGHAIGDELLVVVANRLREGVRAAERRGEARADWVARMGGDEFAVLLNDIATRDRVLEVAQRLQDALNEPIDLRGHRVAAGCSIGIRYSDEHRRAENPESLLRDSDTAMYRAKGAGKGQFVLFDDTMHEQAMRRMKLEHALRRALQDEGTHAVYQPICSLESGRVLGFETLLRWNDPTHGIVTPDEFIPVAEETGIINELGLATLRSAAEAVKHWRSLRPDEPAWVTVNLSKKQLNAPRLVDQISEAVRDAQAEPAWIKLEVTESVIMHDSHRVLPVLTELRERGFLLAMDDFGTGHSSLASLHRFPIDVLKIDRSFVHSMGESRSFGAIVHAIVTLAHNLDMHVVAEGIEDAAQLVQLQALECDFGQGFHIAPPLELGEANRMLTEGFIGRRAEAG